MRSYHIKTTAVCLLVITLLIILYGRIRHHDYIHYDDHLIMIDNSILHRPFTLPNIYRSFTDQPAHVPYKIPLTIITNMARWHFFGNDIGLHHLVSLFFHISTVILIFFLMERATGTIFPAALAAALVGVHPLNVEAVAWLTNINTIMADFFLMATLLAYVHYTKKPGTIRYLLLFIPFGLGLMGKPTLVVVPFLMLALDYWPLQRWGQHTGHIRLAASPLLAGPQDNRCQAPGRARLLGEKIPFLLLALGPYILQLVSRPEQIAAGIRAGGEFHPEAIVYLFWPMIKAVLPTDLTICRAYPTVGSPLAIILSLLLLGVITLVIVRLARRHPCLGFGWGWYLAAMAPIILMMAGSGRPLADRHTYIPLAGIFMAAAYCLASFAQKRRHGWTILLIAALTIVTTLTILSARQLRYWQNSQTVFEHAVHINPENIRARANLGDVFLRSRQVDQAIAQYTRALGTAPDNALLHAKLAYALSCRGDARAARRHYEQALALAPDYAIAHHNFADFLVDQGQTGAARRHYNLALRLAAHSYQTHNNLAVLLSRQGEYALARHHFYRALQLKPDYETARDNLNSLPPPWNAAP